MLPYFTDIFNLMHRWTRVDLITVSNISVLINSCKFTILNIALKCLSSESYPILIILIVGNVSLN